MEHNGTVWTGASTDYSGSQLDQILRDIVRAAIKRVIGPLSADLAALGKSCDLAAMSIGQLKRALLARRTGGRGAKIQRAGSARGRARAVKATLARRKAEP